jgi:hypothetical protein
MGLLSSRVAAQQYDSSQDDFGVAYLNRDNVGTEYHGSQKDIQLRFKEFAQACDFQLKVQYFSSTRGGSANAKYVCKKLNGQQYFDKDVPIEDIQCPFSINVSGFEGFGRSLVPTSATTTLSTWVFQVAPLLKVL